MSAWVVGRLYQVSMADCCVAGTFTARLVEARCGYDDGSGEADEVTELAFENGVRLTTIYAVSGVVVEEM